MKRVLITGASGFIGSHLVEEGLARGYEVWAAVRPTSSRQYLTDPRIRFTGLSLDSRETLDRQLKDLVKGGLRFDLVIHNAGITRARSSVEFFRVNEGLTRNLVTALEEASAVPEKFLYISSLAASGPGNPVSMQPINDGSVSRPIDSYGSSKLAAEQFLASRPGFPYLIFRPTGVYGPRERDYLQVFRTLNRGVELYAGTPRQRISFIYILDLVRLVFAALESGYTCRTWVVSDGRNYSTGEFSAMVKQVLGKRTFRMIVPAGVVTILGTLFQSVTLPFGYVPVLNRDKARIMTSSNWQCDPSQVVRDLGISAEFDLQHGLEETIRWCREHGWI